MSYVQLLLTLPDIAVSIHYTTRDLDSNPVFKGRHARVSLQVSNLNLHEILRAEIAGEHDQYVDGNIQHRSGREWGDMLVAGKHFIHQLQSHRVTNIAAVSALDYIRDELREVVQRSTGIHQRIWFLELDYQASQKRGF